MLADEGTDIDAVDQVVDGDGTETTENDNMGKVVTFLSHQTRLANS